MITDGAPSDIAKDITDPRVKSDIVKWRLPHFLQIRTKDIEEMIEEESDLPRFHVGLFGYGTSNDNWAHLKGMADAVNQGTFMESKLDFLALSRTISTLHSSHSQSATELSELNSSGQRRKTRKVLRERRESADAGKVKETPLSPMDQKMVVERAAFEESVLNQWFLGRETSDTALKEAIAEAGYSTFALNSKAEIVQRAHTIHGMKTKDLGATGEAVEAALAMVAGTKIPPGSDGWDIYRGLTHRWRWSRKSQKLVREQIIANGRGFAVRQASFANGVERLCYRMSVIDDDGKVFEDLVGKESRFEEEHEVSTHVLSDGSRTYLMLTPPLFRLFSVDTER